MDFVDEILLFQQGPQPLPEQFFVIDQQNINSFHSTKLLHSPGFLKERILGFPDQLMALLAIQLFRVNIRPWFPAGTKLYRTDFWQTAPDGVLEIVNHTI